MTDCDLCKLAIRTKVYHEDDICTVLDCMNCGVPMVVWKEHDVHPDPETETHMIAMLKKAHISRFGTNGKAHFDKRRRAIDDHWHAHARSIDLSPI